MTAAAVHGMNVTDPIVRAPTQSSNVMCKAINSPIRFVHSSERQTFSPIGDGLYRTERLPIPVEFTTYSEKNVYSHGLA